MDFSILANFFSNVGFPVAITVYLIYHHDRRLKQIEQEIIRLNTLMALTLARNDPEAYAAYSRMYQEPEEGKKVDR